MISGFGSALLLLALGVPEQVVMEDYLLMSAHLRFDSRPSPGNWMPLAKEVVVRLRSPPREWTLGENKVLPPHRIPSFTSRLTEVITEFVSKGLGMVAPDDQQLAIPREIVVKYTVGAFLGVILWWLENEMPYTAKHMAAKLMRLALNGPYVDNPFAPGL